jgi:hypothetical protein
MMSRTDRLLTRFQRHRRGGTARRPNRLRSVTRHQTTDIVSGLALADRVPVGMVHINDQTSTDEVIAPFGGVGLSGNGYRIGGQEANLAAFTEMQWITVNQEPGSCPF